MLVKNAAPEDKADLVESPAYVAAREHVVSLCPTTCPVRERAVLKRSVNAVTYKLLVEQPQTVLTDGVHLVRQEARTVVREDFVGPEGCPEFVLLLRPDGEVAELLRRVSEPVCVLLCPATTGIGPGGRSVGIDGTDPNVQRRAADMTHKAGLHDLGNVIEAHAEPLVGFALDFSHSAVHVQRSVTVALTLGAATQLAAPPRRSHDHRGFSQRTKASFVLQKHGVNIKSGERAHHRLCSQTRLR